MVRYLPGADFKNGNATAVMNYGRLDVIDAIKLIATPIYLRCPVHSSGNINKRRLQSQPFCRSVQ